jgi:dihydropyrimidine dehydrogenase (NAD+) subunit PreA
LPISGIGGVSTWRDAAEFMTLGAGNVQVCTAAMTYGFHIVQEMISGLSLWMDQKGMTDTSEIVGRAVPNLSDWKNLNLNYITKARINQDSCIGCGDYGIRARRRCKEVTTHTHCDGGDRKECRRGGDAIVAA